MSHWDWTEFLMKFIGAWNCDTSQTLRHHTGCTKHKTSCTRTIYIVLNVQMLQISTMKASSAPYVPMLCSHFSLTDKFDCPPGGLHITRFNPPVCLYCVRSLWSCLKHWKSNGNMYYLYLKWNYCKSYFLFISTRSMFYTLCVLGDAHR